ncbi:DUF4886 domain-containing protein [Kiritimatiellota bacterium B12222]|nr:DUF4886 domain-containing protein [Kiritimatiellota bacterium B12222]
MIRFRTLLTFCSLCFFTFVWSGEDGVVRILGVGNSFTVNSMKYFPQIIANNPEIQAVVGEANIGGCPLDKHVRLAKAHKEDPTKGNAYGYKVNGKFAKSKASLKEVLQDKEWDYVTIQQLSTKSYKPETYTPYTAELIEIIHEYAPQAEVVIHETWSHSVNSYRNTEWKLDPQDMYEKLHAAYEAIAVEFDLEVIPVGTAFQNARALPMWDEQLVDIDVKTLIYPEDKDKLPELKNSLNRVFSWKKNKQGEWIVGVDGFHAGPNGEYLGGLVWYAFFFDQDPRAITYKPKALTEEQAESLRDVAYETVLAPKGE